MKHTSRIDYNAQKRRITIKETSFYYTVKENPGYDYKRWRLEFREYSDGSEEYTVWMSDDGGYGSGFENFDEAEAYIMKNCIEVEYHGFRIVDTKYYPKFEILKKRK